MPKNKNTTTIEITDSVRATLTPFEETDTAGTVHRNVNINVYRATQARPVYMGHDTVNPERIRSNISSFLYSQIYPFEDAIKNLQPGWHHWEFGKFKARPCHKTRLYQSPVSTIFDIVLTLERPGETGPYLITLFGYNRRILLRAQLPDNIITDGHAKAQAEVLAGNFLRAALEDYKLAYDIVNTKKFKKSGIPQV